MGKIKYIQELPDGNYRSCNEGEILHAIGNQRKRLELQDKLEHIKATLKIVQDTCKHPVCWDEPGYIYHTRHCITCGHNSLL